MTEPLHVKVLRFNPESDIAPRFDAFEVPVFDNMAVLDVVMHIQNYMDRSLSFRFSCRIGMCGSCAMYVNGRARLACRTQVSSLKTHDITIMPLPNFPIIRDLVVDMEPFFEKWKKIKPYYLPKDEIREPVTVQPNSKEREFIDDMLDCISCGCCYSACSMVATNKDYLGPAARRKIKGRGSIVRCMALSYTVQLCGSLPQRYCSDPLYSEPETTVCVEKIRDI